MSALFVDVDRETPMLLPPDLRDWVPEDDLVHFILEDFQVNHRGSGNRQFPPHMMLALLIYCYANRLFSSRKNAQATQDRPGEQRRASQPNRSRRPYHAQEQVRRIHRKLQRASRRRC